MRNSVKNIFKKTKYFKVKIDHRTVITEDLKAQLLS